MTADRDHQPTWQPLSAMPVIGSLIDDQLEGAREQYETLLRAEDRPYVLDDATVARVKQVYGDTAADLWLYDTQLDRWSNEALTASQRDEAERLKTQMVALHEVVEAILALAGRFEGHTIESVMAKSDYELGLEWFLGRRRP